MRPTPSVCLVAISVGLLFVFCNPVLPEEPQKAQPSIKELQQKRLAVLEQVCDIAKEDLPKGRVTLAEAYAAQRDLLAARLKYADTQKDRIKACDEAIQDAGEWKNIAQAMRDGARAHMLPCCRPRTSS